MVANDAGDRVTPAIVAFSENEQVLSIAPIFVLEDNEESHAL